MSWLSADQDWNVQTLALWLDRKISHIDLTPEQTIPFILNVIERLIQNRRMDLGFLVKDKFRLKDAVETLIQKYRQEAHKAAYNLFLFPEGPSPLIVTPALCFTYDTDPMNYPYSPDCSLYKGQHTFKKHFIRLLGILRLGERNTNVPNFWITGPK